MLANSQAFLSAVNCLLLSLVTSDFGYAGVTGL